MNDLFAPSPLARTPDPATSHAAARSARRFVDDHHAAILGVLWRKMNCYDIAKFTGLDHVAVARRMGELRDQGKVRDTGETAPGPNGRQCTLWERIISEG